MKNQRKNAIAEATRLTPAHMLTPTPREAAEIFAFCETAAPQPDTRVNERDLVAEAMDWEFCESGLTR